MKWYDPTTDVPGVDGIFYSETDETNASYRPASANGAIPWANTNRRGLIEEFYGYPAGEENRLFDANGLGKYRMKGYAICNGKTHNIPNFGSYLTPDLRGKFTLMPVAGMFNTTLPSDPYVPNNWDAGTNSFSGPLTAGVRLGIAAYNMLQQNVPNYDLTPYITVTNPSHVHPLPSLNHSHSVVARKVGAGGTGSDRDFYAVAMGDSTTRTHGADMTDIAGTTTEIHSGLPIDNHFGAPRNIRGEWVPLSETSDDATGLYSSGPESVGDIAGQGFVQMTDINENFADPTLTLKTTGALLTRTICNTLNVEVSKKPPSLA